MGEDNSSARNGTFTEMNLGFVALYDAFPVTLAILIVLTNGFVIWLILRKNSLHEMPNRLLVSLAFCDLLMGFVGIPLYVSCSSTQIDSLCFGTSVFIIFSSIATILHIIAITADRYVYILKPLRYEGMTTSGRGKRVVAVMWLISLSIALVQLTWLNFSHGVSEEHEESNEVRNNVIYYSVCAAIFFCFPFVFMCGAYVRIFIVVHKQVKKMRHQLNIARLGQERQVVKKETTSRLVHYQLVRLSIECSVHSSVSETIGQSPQILRQDIYKSREVRAIIFYMLILVVYALTFVPYFLLFLQPALGDKLIDMSHEMEYIFIYLRFLESLLNPLLYTMGKSDLRKAAIGALRKMVHNYMN